MFIVPKYNYYNRAYLSNGMRQSFTDLTFKYIINIYIPKQFANIHKDKPTVESSCAIFSFYPLYLDSRVKSIHNKMKYIIYKIWFTLKVSDKT